MVAKPNLTALMMGLAALAAAAGAGAVWGPAADAAVQDQPKSTQKGESRRICRDVTPSGSRLIRRLCRTQAEWDRSQDKSADGLFEQQTETTTQYARDPR